ncbi:hypothetical protein Fmac_005399 [Flemingia macrophylla]|uniref:Uncharacterized protein n=1 Tax=Flemingia macrophylla TaxID=520843 RepID=A0ABD1N7T7_9FABA
MGATSSSCDSMNAVRALLAKRNSSLNPDCSVARAVLLLLLYRFFDCGLAVVLLSWCSSGRFPFLRHIRKPNPSPPNPNTIICHLTSSLSQGQLERGHLPPFSPASQGPFISLSNFGSKHRWEDICAFRAFPYKF